MTMKLTLPKKHKHLNIEERDDIETLLNAGFTFKDIGKELGRDPTTIAKEVKRNLTNIPAKGLAGQTCAKITRCDIRLSSPNKQCPATCLSYISPSCEASTKHTGICNGCENKPRCCLQKVVYRAKEAEANYRSLLKSAREGINMETEDFFALDEMVSLGLKRGHSPAHIIRACKEEVKVSERTIYRLIDERILGSRNIDLPRKVRYKRRRKRVNFEQCEKKIVTKRDFLSFKEYISRFPDTNYVEMDTVYGSNKTTLLTLHFNRCSFMISRILPDRRKESVVCALNDIQTILEKDSSSKTRFQNIFPLLLTDNGSEFDDTLGMEYGIDGENRCNIFYCDPNSAWQKPHVEENHRNLLRILPKGSSFDSLTQEDINLTLSHINSYTRSSLNGKSPYDVFIFLYGKAVADALGIMRIDAKDVLLKPSLVRKN